MPEEPESTRNRTGCFIILAILALFVALYMLVGLNASPGNNVIQDIQTVPTTRR